MTAKKQIRINSKYQPLFEALNSHKRYVLIEGGRGSGKSVALSSFLIHATYKKGYRILFTRYTMTSAETSIIPEFREKVSWLGLDENFRYTSSETINNKTDVNILYRGLKPSSATANSALKSVNSVNIFVLEEAQECADEDLFDRVNFSIRTKEHKNLVIIILNPTDINHWIYKRFYDKKGNKTRTDDTIYIKTTYLDNIENLDDSFIREAERIKETNYLKYKNIFLGEWAIEKKGTLWTQKSINFALDQNENQEYRRVVVAIDPAVTKNSESDETGIIVAGLMENSKYCIIDDLSGKYTPNQWGSKAIYAYQKYQAGCIIGEVNNGGDLIESTIKSIDPSVNFKSVRASKGKLVRAEPVAALYEQGKVMHLRSFSKLETQMTSYNGDDTQSSPDRMDALVWALTELMNTSRVPKIYSIG